MLDDQVHDLVGAGPDGDQAHVPQQALDRVNVRVADAAQDLHGVLEYKFPVLRMAVFIFSNMDFAKHCLET